jgi:hypothetical protein
MGTRIKTLGKVRDSCPTAVCLSCGAHYSGWGLVNRRRCDCGGKLVINSPHDIIIGYAERDEPKDVIVCQKYV